MVLRSEHMGRPAGFELLFLLVLAALYIGSVVWVYRDAEARGKSGFVVATLVGLFCWPGGLLVWLAARPAEAV